MADAPNAPNAARCTTCGYPRGAEHDYWIACPDCEERTDDECPVHAAFCWAEFNGGNHREGPPTPAEPPTDWRARAEAAERLLYSLSPQQHATPEAARDAIADQIASLCIDSAKLTGRAEVAEREVEAIRTRAARVVEAAQHITRCHDISCATVPCTCGLTELVDALTEYEAR